jgi:hypothetical protein
LLLVVMAVSVVMLVLLLLLLWVMAAAVAAAAVAVAVAVALLMTVMVLSVVLSTHTAVNRPTQCDTKAKCIKRTCKTNASINQRRHGRCPLWFVAATPRSPFGGASPAWARV